MMKITIRDSNHACKLELFADGEPIPSWVDEAALSMNDIEFETRDLPDSSILRCVEAENGDFNIAGPMLQFQNEDTSCSHGWNFRPL